MNVRRVEIGRYPGIQVEATVMKITMVPILMRSADGPTHIAHLRVCGRIGYAPVYCWKHDLNCLESGATIEVYAKNKDLLAHHNDRWKIDPTSLTVTR